MIEQDLLEGNIFYNYIYLDPSKPGYYNYGNLHFDYEPFYVGKGKNNRCYSHLFETKDNTYNPKKFNKIQKIRKNIGYDPIILKIYEDLEESIALQNEKDLIKNIGRHDLKLGPLTNLTDGGDNTNWISFNDIKKDEIRLKCKIASSGESNPMYGKSIKDVWIKKYGLDVANKMWYESNEKRSINCKNKGTKGVIQYDKNNNIIKIYPSLTEASIITGININSISFVCKGKRKSAGGYIWKYEKINEPNVQ